MTNRLQLNGHINGRVIDKNVSYIAAAPSDARSSEVGSLLPFENSDQAFNNTPNIGSFQLGYNNSFQIELLSPNSYFEYSNEFGKVLVPPCVYITYDNINVRVLLDRDSGSQFKGILNSDRIESEDVNNAPDSEDQWVTFKKYTQSWP